MLGLIRTYPVLFILSAIALIAGADRGAGLRGPFQVGDKVPTFYVRAITGPLNGKSVCYICRNGDRPVVMVFVREITPELRKLLKGIDELVDTHRAEGLRSFGVFMANESKMLLPVVQTLAFDEKLNMPLTISASSVDGAAGPHLQNDSAITIVLYRDQKVTANFSYRAGELDSEGIVRVLSEVRKLAAGS